jgi:hypothetical protein
MAQRLKLGTMPRPSKDKKKMREAAIKTGRKVLWKDGQGVWHAATDRDNTPYWAVETEDV